MRCPESTWQPGWDATRAGSVARPGEHDESTERVEVSRAVRSGCVPTTEPALMPG